MLKNKPRGERKNEKTDVLKFAPSSYEYIVLHAIFQKSRGRNPSATLPWILNPRKALAYANQYAYFPEGDSYLNAGIPEDYVCAVCGATHCKLWREYQTFQPKILCAKCAATDQNKCIDDIDDQGKHTEERLGTRSDQIGWHVPAVPLENEKGYWGYTSVPQPGCEWWRKLPTFTTPKEKWRLEGYDTFDSSPYHIDGEYNDEEAAKNAANNRLASLEKSQPSSSSGGQGTFGIQDQVFIVRPDGSKFRYFASK